MPFHRCWPKGILHHAIFESEEENRAVLAIRERVLGKEHPDTLTSLINLANALWAQGKYAAAEEEDRAVVAIREHVVGPEHPQTLLSRNNLAIVLDAEGKYAEAEGEDRAVLAIRERVLSTENPDVATSCFNLALCLEHQAKNEEALQFAKRAENVYLASLGAEHPWTKDAKLLRVSIETKLK